uniref:Uncharacterized protein n=1 Tax=Oryza meridionalis TaxID=40149 RepID=A0A0E0ETJ3_9ORYZ
MDSGGGGGNDDTGGEGSTWMPWSGVDATPPRRGGNGDTGSEGSTWTPWSGVDATPPRRGGNGDTGGESSAWTPWTGVDATPLRHGIDTTVDEIREALGLAPVSAAMARRRRAAEHLRRAAEYVELRARGGCHRDDARCRRVQSALAAQVRGACARCGSNFCVVPVVESMVVSGGGGRTVRCGCCGERVDLEAATAPPPAATRRQQGWQPWDQGYNM